jgi:hypothetical protein
VTRRVVVILLGPVAWAPPGIDSQRWRTALTEDMVDLVVTLREVTPAIAAVAADRTLAEAVAWPGMPIYEVPERTVNAALAAAEADAYDQAAVLAADAPDLPGLVIGKLLRPLTSRPVAVAPVPAVPGAARGPGLLGVAARLPVPDWLPAIDLDRTAPREILAAAPRPGDVAVTADWHRQRTAADLAALDPAVPGWETTRMLLDAAT